MIVLQKEKCDSCLKFISLGQSITECNSCSTAVIHTNCYKKSKFKNINNNFYCLVCSNKVELRYNPFKDLEVLDSLTDNESENLDNFTGDLKEASSVLDKCIKINTKSLINLMSDQYNMNIYFHNIDGNKSNFNTLAAELSCFNEKFSLIGIAETNADPKHKDLYPLNDYKSYYGDKIPGKITGTGVALYVHESFNAIKYEEVSGVSTNLETLFVKINKGKKSINAGVVYRSPNSSFSDFYSEFEKIIKTLQKNVLTYIIGDFNLNLLKSATNSEVEAFEALFLSEGLYPVISLITHQRNNCNGSCIDNIFTNQISSIAYSGVVSDQGAAHSPIFSLSNLDFSTENMHKKEKQTQKYSFSKANTDKLLDILKVNHNALIGSDDDCPTFDSFLESFSNAIDQSCKLLIPRCTIRNAINNPWITDSVINSVETKQNLYDQWKQSCSSKIPDGNEKLYKLYSEYRYHLKHVIKYIKKQFYNRKFSEANGDPKKTWKIINEIRGKHNKKIKPQFLINNEKIIERI